MNHEPTNDHGSGDEETAEYEVGYGKPPKTTRWRKGVSGNPRGRPKSARGLKTDLRAELVSRMDIRMNGKTVSGTRQQLMLRTLSARAASGDVRATRLLIDLVMQVFGPEDHGGSRKGLSAQDQQILDELLTRNGTGADDASQTNLFAQMAPKEPNSSSPANSQSQTDGNIEHSENSYD